MGAAASPARRACCCGHGGLPTSQVVPALTLAAPPTHTPQQTGLLQRPPARHRVHRGAPAPPAACCTPASQRLACLHAAPERLARARARTLHRCVARPPCQPCHKASNDFHNALPLFAVLLAVRRPPGCGGRQVRHGPLSAGRQRDCGAVCDARAAPPRRRRPRCAGVRDWAGSSEGVRSANRAAWHAGGGAFRPLPLLIVPPACCAGRAQATAGAVAMAAAAATAAVAMAAVATAAAAPARVAAAGTGAARAAAAGAGTGGGARTRAAAAGTGAGGATAGEQGRITHHPPLLAIGRGRSLALACRWRASCGRPAAAPPSLPPCHPPVSLQVAEPGSLPLPQPGTRPVSGALQEPGAQPLAQVGGRLSGKPQSSLARVVWVCCHWCFFLALLPCCRASLALGACPACSRSKSRGRSPSRSR